MQAQPVTISAPWVRFRAIAYLTGRGVSFGCGNDPIVPHDALDAGKYSLNADIIKYQHVDICDLNYDFISNSSLDHVFIGSRENPPIGALCAKLKLGGHCVIQALDCSAEALRALVAPHGQWREKDIYVRDRCTLGIFKLLARSKNGVLPPKPRAARRACIARYGAIGDMLMISPLIRLLHEDGYEVTLNITPYCAEVLRNNPYVSNIIIQERDAIPNQDLGGYWEEWMNDYDKYINLSESIEGKILKVEGRRDFYTTKQWRNALNGSNNYFDQTMRLGGYSEAKGLRPELYFSKAEEKEAQHVRSKLADKFMVLWAAKGSSYHKCYPLLQPVLSSWLDAHADAQVFMCGGPQDTAYAVQHKQVVNLFGAVPIRELFCLTKYADLVVGPETALTCASAAWDNPKIILLSHSNHENLCKYYTNHVCLAPEVACAGCLQLHYSLNSCPLISISNEKQELVGEYPACSAIGISPKRLCEALDNVYNAWKAKQPSAG